MAVYKKINGQAVRMTTEGHTEYYFETEAAFRQALPTLEVGAIANVAEGGVSDLDTRVQTLETEVDNFSVLLEITTDGVKTYSDYLTQVFTYITTHYTSYTQLKSLKFMDDANRIFSISLVSGSSSAIKEIQFHFVAVGAYLYARGILMNNLESPRYKYFLGSSITDLSSSVPNSDLKLRLIK